MKVLRFASLFFALSCLFLPSAIIANGKPIAYRFQLLTQGANAFAPAKARKVQLKFQTAPKTIFSTVTNSQGLAEFRLDRCNEEDRAELIYRSDFPGKQLQRVEVTISCGTEDGEVNSYFMGIYSLTYGKYLASNLDDLGGACNLCKK